MPYIKSPSYELRVAAESLQYVPSLNPGELNWLISSVLARYLQLNGLRYAPMSEAIAGCHLAAAELQRRVLNPYEGVKLTEVLQAAVDGAGPEGDPYYELLAQADKPAQVLDTCRVIDPKHIPSLWEEDTVVAAPPKPLPDIEGDDL